MKPKKTRAKRQGASADKINIVINCGSSSLKYKVFSSGTEKCIVRGLVEKVGTAEAVITHRPAVGGPVQNIKSINDHRAALREVLGFLLSGENKLIKDKAQIRAAGHRIVHGGKYSEPVVVGREVKEYLKDVTFELAPLHNPYNYQGIEAMEKVLPGVVNIGVFDTAFHQTLPERAFMYAVPYIYYRKHLVRKYGFHGTSHQYVAEKAAALIKKPVGQTRIITCHIGNGVSLSAVKGLKCIDTSMGFTPLEGVMMGTRSGDIDPAAVLHLMMSEELGIHEMDTVLNKQSGLLGVSGVSNDMRDILRAAREGNERAKLAFDMFCYRIKKYIGSYMAALNGADAIVFTAGAGENSPRVRAGILKNLENIGIIVDRLRNSKAAPGEISDISSPSSRVKIFVIPTNEELMISRMIDEKLSQRKKEK